MSDERFSILKFFDFTPLAFAKVVGLALKAALIILIILGVVWVKNLIFPPAPANVNQPNIKVESGGTLHYENIQQSEKKRPWWMPRPFAEIYGFVEDDRQGAGARGGVKWEW